MIAIFSFTSKNFFRTSTMFTILKQVSITGIVCIGQTMVMLTGGIDLSVDSFAQGSIVGIPNQVILTIILFIIFS